MPELPEVEIVRQSLNKKIQQKKVKEVIIRNKNLRLKIPSNFNAGFMRIIGPRFIEAFQGRVLNLHPSLLPSFKGAHGIRDAFEYGVKVTGCTVHWVTPQLDAGPVIEQKTVRIENSDTLPLLEKKIHAAEHQLLPEVVAGLSKGAIPLP